MVDFRFVIAGIATTIGFSQPLHAVAAREQLRRWAGLSTGEQPAERVESPQTAVERVVKSTAFSGSVTTWSGDNGRAEVCSGSTGSGKNIEPATRFDLGSVTKQFTALAAALLIQEQKLSSTSTLQEIFSDVPADRADISVLDLLNHTSGLVGDPPLGVNPHDRDLFIAAILRSPRSELRGTFAYSNLNYNLLAAAIERKAGMKFETYVEAHILVPLGLVETRFMGSADLPPASCAIGKSGPRQFAERAHLTQSGWGMRGASGLYSTARDLERFGRLAPKLIPPDVMATLQSWDTRPYQYGTYLSALPDGRRVLEHTGSTQFGFHSAYCRSLDGTCGAAVVSNGGSPIEDDLLHACGLAMAGEVAATHSHALPEIPLGRFTLSAGGSVEITKDNDAIIVEVRGNSDSMYLLACPVPTAIDQVAKSISLRITAMVQSTYEERVRQLTEAALFPKLAEIMKDQFAPRAIASVIAVPSDDLRGYVSFAECVPIAHELADAATKVIMVATPQSGSDFVIEGFCDLARYKTYSPKHQGRPAARRFILASSGTMYSFEKGKIAPTISGRVEHAGATQTLVIRAARGEVRLPLSGE